MNYLYQVDTDMSNVRRRIGILKFNMLDYYKREVLKISQKGYNGVIFTISYQIIN